MVTRRLKYDKTTVDCTKADRERINTLAAQLTAEGPGKYGQWETIRWLLDGREKVTAALVDEAIDTYTRERQS